LAPNTLALPIFIFQENKQYEDEIVIPSVFVGYDDGLTLRRYDFGRITRYVFCFVLSNNEFIYILQWYSE
jgi:hypothetical protein